NAFGKFSRNESRSSGEPKQRDIAQIPQQLGMVSGMQQYQVLRDEFDVDHAAGITLQIEVGVGVGVGGTELSGHFLRRGAQLDGIAVTDKNFEPDCLESLVQGGVACAKACTCNGLMLPEPCMLALIAGETVARDCQQAGIPVGAQA